MNNDYKTVITDQVFEAVHGVVNPRSSKVLEALFLGLEVKLNDQTFRLFEHENGGYTPGVVVKEELHCGCPDLSLVYFTKVCDELSDKEFEEILNRVAFSKVVSKGLR